MGKGNHLDCKHWDYETHPKRKQLRARCERLTGWAKRWPRRFERYGLDTRRGHRLLFGPFAPPQCLCLAGTYRGSQSCPALLQYAVGVGGAPKGVGALPQYVETAMALFESRGQQLVHTYRQSLATLTPEEAFVKLVDILCDLLEVFFTIHPYANGNGHAGRMLVWVTLAREGFVPKRWCIDDKQPYGNALNQYRAGKPEPLRLFLIRLAR